MKQVDSIPDPLNHLPPHWKRLLLVAVLGVSLAMVLVYPFPVNSRLWSALFDLAHAPCFFAAFLLIAGLVDPSCIGFPTSSHRVLTLGAIRLILLAAALTIIGVTCEVLQGFVGRSPSVSDALANGSGLVAALAWCLSRKMTGRIVRGGLVLIAAVLLIMPGRSPVAELHDCYLQFHAFPTLASFERNRELHRWEGHEATIERTTEWATDGPTSMKVQAKAGTIYPGVSFQWPEMNWQGFAALELDLLNPSDRPFTLNINISDVAHASSDFNPTDRFRTSIELHPGKPTPVRIPLAKIQEAPKTRTMNLRRMNAINLFSIRPTADIEFLVDYVRLSK